MRIGIIGAGHIAEKMSRTTREMKGTTAYAVASRSLEKARNFASEWGFEKAYGSYRELCDDPDVELVYVATPHSHHLDPVKMALNAGKPVLCEKSFAANAREASEMIGLSHEKGVFLCEAMWTRFLPLSLKISELLKSGVIGEPKSLYANLSYPVSWKPRLQKAELAGGALLDLGVYCINFARMYFGVDIERIESTCLKGGENDAVDMQETITMVYRDGRIANLQSSALCASARTGMICGTEGYLMVDNINCPELVTVFNKNHEPVAEYHNPEPMITGFEYEVRACIDSIKAGRIESEFITHDETLAIMEIMDSLRKSWGVVFPMD